MISTFFHTVFYNPLYNGLVFLMNLSPLINLGLAIVIFTVIIRLILFPLSRKAVRTQIKMREIEPEMKKIREEYKDNREEQARKTMALYKEKGVNPFSGILLLLIQLPIIFALYKIFYSAGLPSINRSLLYPFIHAPESVNPFFLGYDLTAASIIFALIAAVTQYLQIRYSMPVQPKSETPSFSNDLARSMSLQMRYVLPVIIFFIAWKLSAAVALYWIISNIFTIGQELYVRRERSPKTV